MSATPIDRLNAALSGRYRIEREIGEGGMATVHLADDLRHERKVALKVLKPEVAAVVGAERFLAEIKTTANLQHPHILPLFDSGEAAGFLFYVMPYVAGESLRERLDREKQLPIEEAVRIACDVAEALHAAHEQGVVHRDIKPANILMSRGRPLLADFGIALGFDRADATRFTQAHVAMGTPKYMSPEQATGESVDRRADVYSLTCVLYEMLVGEPPYAAASQPAVLARLLTESPIRPRLLREAVSEELDEVVMKGLETAPADRFQTGADLGDALSTSATLAKTSATAPRVDGGEVFLSYNLRDLAAVEAVAEALIDRGISVLLDRWYLASEDRPWQDVLRERMSACRAVVVFVGPAGLGRWQQREREFALDRRTRDEAFPVIPVLLPGAEPALGLVDLNILVDLRSGLHDPVQLEAVSYALAEEPRGRPTRDRVAAVCPYRGLQPFREEDAALFFGRDAFSRQLVAKVARSHFVAVVGASGSGKSSVVQAGLVPRLRSVSEPQTWEVVTLVPGERPLHALAAALIPLLEPRLETIERRVRINESAGYLADERVSLRDLVEDALQAQPGTDRLLVFVDQWEEIYTLCRDSEVRRRFVDELLEATESGFLTVVLTLRGDFYAEALAHRGLSERMQDSTVNLGPMRREELRLAIESPAARVGLGFQDGLVDRILDAVGDEPGNLPLLEFVLAGLWRGRRGDVLHHQAYEELGELEGAMAQRAEEVYARLTRTQQHVARKVVRRLVRVSDGGEATRQRVRLDEVAADARPVVDELARERLLVTGRDESSQEEILEVAHEALIQHWHRLQRWVNEDRELLLWNQRLAHYVREWQAAGRDESFLLKGPVLAEAERWLAERPDDIDRGERAFVHASTASRGRQNRRRRMAATAAVVALMTVTGALGWQVLQSSRASERRSLLSQVASTDPGVVTPAFERLVERFDQLPERLFDLLARSPSLRLEVVRGVDRTHLGSRRAFGHAIYLLEDAAARDSGLRVPALALRDSVHAAFVGTTGLAPPTTDQDTMLNRRIRIPGGTFPMGSVGGMEAPVRDVTLSPFSIQQHEVTNEEYRRFDPEHVFDSGTERHPAVNVLWDDAMAYAVWLGGSLPTEAQWEFVARGETGRTFPWGDAPPDSTLANFDCVPTCESTTPVGSYPAGATLDGVQDLAGNVWEWVSDWYGPYPTRPETNPIGPDSGTLRVFRGGSFVNDARFLRGAFRGSGSTDPSLWGFRVAWGDAR